MKIRLDLENEQVLELIEILQLLSELLSPPNDRMKIRQTILNELRRSVGRPMFHLDVRSLDLENEQVLELIGILEVVGKLLGPTNDRMKIRQTILNELRLSVGLPIFHLENH